MRGSKYTDIIPPHSFYMSEGVFSLRKDSTMTDTLNTQRGAKPVVITTRLMSGTAANGGEIFLYATWDSKQEQEDGTFLFPEATGLVSSIRYKNMGPYDKTIIIGGRTYIAPAGTPDTTMNIPAPQQPNMYTTAWQIY